MDTSANPRSIKVLLFENVNLLDIAGPVQAFTTALVNGRHKYTVNYISSDGHPVRACCGLQLGADHGLDGLSGTDDLLIPGGTGVDILMGDTTVLDAVRRHNASTKYGRLISICSGALVLAAAGILDGQSATTHWSREADTRNYTNVLWDLDQISTSNGRVFTSAGVTTGIDLALSIIRTDCGPAAALAVARELVVQLRRTGGQSQYAMHLAGQFTRDDALTQLIERIVSQPHLDWTLDMLADSAGMNPRTLSRHFKRDLNETPAQFVEKIRVDHARGLLAENVTPKQVAVQSGFGDLQRMRRAFQRRLGVGVDAYRNVFRA